MRYLWFGVAAPSFIASTWWPQGESVDHSHMTWDSMNAPYKSISIETNIKGSALHRSGENRLSMAVFFGVMGLSSQFFIFQCPTQSFTRSASWRINLFHFLAFLFQAMYGLLVFYMIFQAVMILKGSYNVVSMKWDLRNCIAFNYFSTFLRLFFLGIFMYGSGFLLWNLGELKISQSSAKLNPQRMRSALKWKEYEVTCPRFWLRWPNFMDGGTCLRVGQTCSPPKSQPFFQCYITG